MGLDLNKLRNTTWVIALIFSGLGGFIIIAMFALSAPPWTLEDILMTLVWGGSYVSGLLIGRKWPLIGGIMSLILPIVGVIITVVPLIRIESGSEYIVGSFILYLIMMIPGFLYLLFWYLQRKFDQNQLIGDSSK